MKSTDTIGEALRATQQRLEGDDITDAENAAAIVAAAEAPIGAPAHDDGPQADRAALLALADRWVRSGEACDRREEDGTGDVYRDAAKMLRSTLGAPKDDADLPVMQSTATDAAIDEAVAQAKGEPATVWHWRTPLFAIGCNSYRAHKRATTVIAHVTCPACLAALRSPPPDPRSADDALLAVRQRIASLPPERRATALDRAQAAWSRSGSLVARDGCRIEGSEVVWPDGERWPIGPMADITPQPNRFAVQEAPAWVQAFVEAFGATITKEPASHTSFVPRVCAVITRGNVEAAHEVLRRHVSGHYEIRVERAETSAGGES